MRDEPASPAFKPRPDWLRQYHRPPLPERFEAIFGDAGIPLLKELRAAYKKSEGPINEAWELNARTILRACAQIPAGEIGMRRRVAYVRTCIAKMTCPAITDESEMDGAEILESSPLEAIARKERTTVEMIWPRFLKLHGELIKAFQVRWPDNSEKVERRVQRIVSNATTKNYPLRYLVRVLHIERADQHRHSSKSGNRK